MSIGQIALMCVFAWMKIDMLNTEYREMDEPITIMTTTQQRAYQPTDTFSFENGLNIAVAFTAYDNDESYLLDPSYGELIFHTYSWGEKPDGEVWSTHERIQAAVCTDE